MKNSIFRLLITTVLASCSANNDKLETAQETTDEEIKKEKIEVNKALGVWTDGTGPNASFRIEEDSIYDVEHFERTRYQLTEDTLTIFYSDELFKAKILKLDADSLIYESQYGITKFWRFKD